MFVVALLWGCAGAEVQPPDALENDALSGIEPSAVAKQTIGNCWAFATTAWVERLHTRAGGGTFDLSESYLTYLYVLDQLQGRTRYSTLPVFEGANFEIARDLIARYGVRQQSAFAADGPTGTASSVQVRAMAATNAWLKAGGLGKLPQDRSARDAALRLAMDGFWELAPVVRSDLDGAFGKDMARTLRSGSAPTFAAYRVLRPEDLSAALYKPGAGAPVVGTLADVVRAGPHQYAHVEVAPDITPLALRAHQKRVQRLLHQGIPVWMGWWMEPGAITMYGYGGRFALDTYLRSGPRPDHIGHATLLYDYEVTLPDGSTLAAGEKVTDSSKLAAALDARAAYRFWRVQNSWGTGMLPSFSRPSGSYDLDNSYLSTKLRIQLPLGAAERVFWMGSALPADVEP